MRHPPAIPALAALLTGAFVASLAFMEGAVAQSPAPSIPGMIVSTPSGGAAPSIPGMVVTPSGPSGPPTASSPPPGMMVAPAPKAPPAKTATPKAKPKPRSRAVAMPSGGPIKQGIVVLVNDEPITGYEVEQRARFMVLGANIQDQARANMKQIAERPSTSEDIKAILQNVIQSNPGKTREQLIAIFEERKKQYVLGLQKRAIEGARASVLPGMRKSALEELIEERLKLQEAKKLNIVVSEEDVKRALKGVAERNKMTEKQFAEHMKGMGGDVAIMEARFRSSLAWREVVRRKYGHMITVSGRDVDRFVAADSNDAADQAELHLHKITLAMPTKFDQAALAAKYKEAERIKGNFKGCKTSAEAIKGISGAKLEDLGFRAPSTTTEPTRSWLTSAREGEMLPPSVTATGVELYAVCARKVVKADEKRREQATEELTMKEYDLVSRQHLRDLRQNANIEYRK
jgi:peptidyl-prolyl cis-trans isomerase SurA